MIIYPHDNCLFYFFFSCKSVGTNQSVSVLSLSLNKRIHFAYNYYLVVIFA